MSGRRLAAVAAALALLLPAGGGRLAAAARPSAPVAAVPRPAPVRLPPALPAAGGTAPLPTAAGLTRALAGPLAARALGWGTAVAVADVATGTTLFTRNATAAVVPASTAKLATAVAALDALGPRRTFTTRVVTGAAPGRIVLVGGGDPTFGVPGGGAGPPGASLDVLAAGTAAAVRSRGVTAVTLGYDAGLFAGPAMAPGWKPSYVSGGDVAPVSALALDEGRLHPDRSQRTDRPARTAAVAFARLLARHGVAVRGVPAPAMAAAGADVLAAVSSPPLAVLVERMLLDSDNDVAEALARQVALATGHPATFAGGAAAVTAVVTRFGVPAGRLRLVDGSGLSPLDRVTATALVSLLEAVASADHPPLRPVVTGLPVAGFAGTLATRFDRPGTAAAAGDVRAKTGTLDHVSALAGFTVDADGRLLAFALVADRVPALDPTAAEGALDRAAAAVTACGCRR